jgi:hypothetical protein
MERKENSAKILRFIYFYEEDGLNDDKILEASQDLDSDDVRQALDDLDSKNLVDFKSMVEGSYRFIELTGRGLELAEDEDKLLESFSISINLGVVKTDWNFNV